MFSQDFYNLENAPTTTVDHLCVDYVELLCLAHIDRAVSRASAIDRFHDAGRRFMEEEELVAEDWFRQLEFRKETFREFYPFSLTPDLKELYRESTITPKHKLYIFYLLSSNLRHFPSKTNKKTQTLMGNYFERASVFALEHYLAPGCKAYLFGKNPLNSGPYTGTLWDRIEKFSEDIGDKPRHSKSHYPSDKEGERGLDVVGWRPFRDKNQGLLIVCGQCACGYEDWEDKQLTLHAVRWKSHIIFTASPVNMVFIPHCFRQSNGEWHDVTRINDSILIDRLRLVHLLEGRCDSLVDELPYDVVDRVIEYIESLV